MKKIIAGNPIPKRNKFAGFVIKRRGAIVEIISALFILLFLYTALSKSFEINSTTAVLEKTPRFSKNPQGIAWTVVVLEYLAAIALFMPRTRKLGLYTSLGLMTAFTGYIAYMMAFVPNLPCSCGGVISKMTWGQHLIFNMLFILLAIIGLLLSRRQSKIEVNSEPVQVVFT